VNTESIVTILLVAGILGMAPGSMAADSAWTRKTNMPTGRMSPAAGVVNDKVYVIGGGRDIVGPHLATVEEYDPESNTWAQKADMPTARSGLAAAVVNGKIYVVGGEPSAQASLTTVEEYDPVTDTWTNKANTPTPRTFHSACALDGRIYVVGGVAAGVSGFDRNPSVLDVYDPTTDTWTQKAPITTPRAGAAAVAAGGRIYFIGGVTGDLHNAPVTTVEEYDPATDAWTSKANMPSARAFLSAAVVDGQVYAVGGGTWSAAFRTTVEVYDSTTDTWTSRPPMPTARAAVVTSVVNRKLYAIGGTQEWYPGAGMATVEEYDSTPSVSLRRIGNSLSLFWNGILQSTDTLDGPTWLDVTPAPPRIPWTVDPNQAGPMRFYRAR